MSRIDSCANLNHRRARPTIGHCPECGVIVNDQIPIRTCSEAQHATARRDRAAYCVDCGVQLIVER